MESPSGEEFGIQGVQRSLVGPKDFIRNIEQGFLDQAKILGERWFTGVKVEQASDVLLAVFSLVKRSQGGHGVSRVVLGRDGFESDGGTVVQGDVSEVPFGYFDFLDRVEMRNVVGHVERDFVFLDVAVRAH